MCSWTETEKWTNWPFRVPPDLLLSCWTHSRSGRKSNSLSFIPPLNTHLLQTLSVLGALLGARDVIPTFKEIVVFGQKVEQKCSTCRIVNTKDWRRCYLKQCMSSKGRGYCEREYLLPWVSAFLLICGREQKPLLFNWANDGLKRNKET